MNYCGIDLASKASAVCILDKTGKVLKEFEVMTDADGYRNGLGKLSRMRCVLEASPLAEWAAQQLEALGHEVVVIDPRKAKAVICTKKKTDKLDARKLAKMGQTGWYTEVHRKSEQARVLRSRLKARKGLVETAQAMGSRIRGLLRAHGIKLGHVKESEYRSRVETEVKQHIPALWSAFEALLVMRTQALEAAEQMQKAFKMSSREDAVCRHLMSAPGVGPLVASAYVATIDDPQRFKRSDQVPAYLGLVPSVQQSGEMAYRGRITKEGDGLLRWLLVEAAHVLLTRTRKSCALKRWGLRLAKKKGLGKAKVAVARKLAMLLHRMWVTGKPFDWARV